MRQLTSERAREKKGIESHLEKYVLLPKISSINA